jgi:predicted nucleic-acid-binding Zn-ribbon protein
LIVDVMKNSGKCPKCGSTNIWNPQEQKRIAIERGIWFKITFWRSAKMVPSICLDCGYSEIYCDNDGIKAIKAHFTPKLEAVSMKKCPICGFKSPSTAKLCDECGSVFE